MDPLLKLNNYLKNQQEDFFSFIRSANIQGEFGYYNTFTDDGKDMQQMSLSKPIIQIFSDEWLNKTELVKRKILKENNGKSAARKIILKEISTLEKNQFLNDFHIQGADRSTIKIGGFLDDALVGCGTFIKSFRQKNNTCWELSRFAASQAIIGLLPKMLKYIKVTYNIKEVETFADLRWSRRDNNIYLKTGFKEVGISPPCYYYSSSNTERIHRFCFTKRVLKDKFPNLYADQKTEKEIMGQAGYNLIYDAGSVKYRFRDFS
jgi:hypothetical protein